MIRRLLLASAAVLVLAMPVEASANFVDDVVNALSAQGYSDIDVTQTLLGRARIVATNEEGTRELVVNPRTGEVLRDVWTPRHGDQRAVLPTSVRPGGDDDTGRDDDDDDDENDDEDEEDDSHDDDDNSGKGSDDDEADHD
jgi:hypothetical protein